MKRLLTLAALVLALHAGTASAQFINISGAPGTGKGPGNMPPPLGPWYNYWPLEAHFQVPAMPEYPYYSAPQTLPIGQPGQNAAGAYKPNSAGPAMAYGGYPGQAPNAGNAAYAGVNPYAGYPYGAARPQAPATAGYPAYNGQQQQQARPAPTQRGAYLYDPYPGLGYPPSGGYNPNAVRR